MGLVMKARHLPVRTAIGAFMLSGGLDKRSADTAEIGELHGLAVGAYPAAKRVDPTTFVKALSTAEIALGLALLVPIVPTFLAGAALTAFSAGTLGLYLRTPGMRREGSLRPTQQGLPIAKDVWLLGAGVSMMVGALTDRT